jgi:hypothetical protein
MIGTTGARFPAWRPALLCLGLALAGCGDVKLWPFGGGPTELSRAPADATAYRCEGGRQLYVRLLEGGAAAWVILPEREIRLERESAGATNYAYRSTRLEISGSEATLFERNAVTLGGCKSGGG